MARYNSIEDLPAHHRKQAAEQMRQSSARIGIADGADLGVVPHEHDEQSALMQWADVWAWEYPELGLLYANANGGYRPDKTARAMKREGLKAGVPDLFLPVPRNGKHGFYIEMKRANRKNHATPQQQRWIRVLQDYGYRCEVCYGFEEAKVSLCDYLGIDLEDIT